MKFTSVRPWMLAAIATLALGSAAPHPAGAGGGTDGYMEINGFTEAYEPSGNIVTLTGSIANECTKPLPANSEFVFEYNGVAFAGFTLTALTAGSTQDFSAYGSITSAGKSKNNTTTLGFTIVLPKSTFGVVGDQKTSPCTITFTPGVP